MNTLIKIAAALGFASVLLPASVQAANESAGTSVPEPSAQAAAQSAAAPAAAAPAAAAPAAAAPAAAAPAAAAPAAETAEKKRDRSGFYVGAGVGQAQMTDNPPQTNGQEVSENSTPYSVFAGYRFGLIPILDFAAEVGYMDLGTFEGTTGATATQYKAQGLGASVLVIFPITIFDIYGRLGVTQVNLDKTFNGVTTTSDGTAGVYGAGVGVRFGRIGVRAEYDRIDVPDVKSTDVGMVSVYFQF